MLKKLFLDGLKKCSLSKKAFSKCSWGEFWGFWMVFYAFLVDVVHMKNVLGDHWNPLVPTEVAGERQWHFTAGKRHFHRFQQNDTPMGVERASPF